MNDTWDDYLRVLERHDYRSLGSQSGVKTTGCVFRFVLFEHPTVKGIVQLIKKSKFQDAYHWIASPFDSPMFRKGADAETLGNYLEAALW